MKSVPNVLLFLVICLFFSKNVESSSGSGSGSSGGEEDVGKNDFHIYELIEKAQLLYPESTNLYSIFGLEWGASADEIAASFRRASIRYHPDKQKSKPANERKRAQEVYGLLTSVADLLRSESGRKRYEWILYEAPPWHKSTFYARRTLKRFTTARYSLYETIILLSVLIVFGEYLLLVLVWFTEWGRRWESRRQVREFGAKEMKRMRRKVERSTSPQFLGMVDTNYEALNRSTAALLPFPKPWDTFPFRIILSVFNLICFCVKRRPAQVQIKEEAEKQE